MASSIRFVGESLDDELRVMVGMPKGVLGRSGSRAAHLGIDGERGVACDVDTRVAIAHHEYPLLDQVTYNEFRLVRVGQTVI